LSGFALSLLLLSLQLPEHVASPGVHRLALSLGFEEELPAFELRLGLSPLLALDAEAIMAPDAPLMGAKLRLMVGERSENELFSWIWFSGRLRPSFDTEVLAGADARMGFGVLKSLGPWSLILDGGLALGLPFQTLGGINTPDQQGGVFALQRLELHFDLSSWLSFSLGTDLLLPLSARRLQESQEESVQTWSLTWGGRSHLRF